MLLSALAAAALAPASALAMVAPRSDGALSPVLAELAKPAVRSKSPARQAAILSVAAEGPGGLLRQGGRVLVEVRFPQGAASSLASLREAGARIVAISRRYQTITAAVLPASLRALAGVAGVSAVGEIRSPLVAAVDCEGGSVISEGVTQLHAKAAREAFGVDGSGVTVGVLSDSFDQATTAETGATENEPIATHAANDIETGDLPGPANTCLGQEGAVNDVEDQATSADGEVFDEGRGMLQIVHDVAPGASLAFATAFKGEVSFAHNIEALASAGAKVIVDDVSYFEEPFFQDGPVAAAVNKVTSEGVTYLSAAGNNNLTDPAGNEIASWEAPAYRDSGTCPAAVTALKGFNGTHCMDFDPGAGTDPGFGIEVEPKATLTVDLQWDEPWFGVETDLDAFLLASGGQLIAQSYAENTGKGGSQKPSEIIQWKNESASPASVNLAINRYSGGASPRLKFALLENGAGVSETEYPQSNGGDVVGPTIYGHAGAASAISVAAERYTNNTAPERFSSRGPVTHYFGPVAGITEAAALNPPVTISKPDVTATDCGVTTFFAQLVASVWRFCGTSAAAPHAAGVAALMTEAAEGA
nr:S8 family serine peptidase [Solirubrobacterales bacterium]